MHPEMPQLYALHEVDAHILALERTLRNLDNGDAAKATLLAARREQARRDEALKRARVAQSDAETTLKANETKQDQLKKRLYGGSVVGVREAEAVEHEIAGLKEKAGELETSILENMEVIEAGESALAAQKTTVAEREQELADTLAAYAQRSSELQAQISAAQSERAEAAAPLSKSVITQYDAARKRNKDTGVALLEGVTCAGCRMQVPGQALNHMSSTQNLIPCDNCGRFLYRKP
jgi:predicted  nucleic acid-binding Zn-ribbon protein